MLSSSSPSTLPSPFLNLANDYFQGSSYQKPLWPSFLVRFGVKGVEEWGQSANVPKHGFGIFPIWDFWNDGQQQGCVKSHNMDLGFFNLRFWFDRRQQGWVKSISSQPAPHLIIIVFNIFFFIIPVISIKTIQSGKYCAGVGAKNIGGRNTRPTLQ